MKNGLEAINRLKNESYCNCSLSDDNKFFCMGELLKESEELNVIQHELKVLQILKEKKVNLQFISYKLSIGYSTQEILEEYNAFDILNDLTQEEMQLIVDWLKED